MEYVISLLGPMGAGALVTLKLFFITLALAVPLGLALALARTAAAHGALLLNYCPVEELLYEGKRVAGLICRDGESGRRHEIRARCVINATGPWVDALREQDGLAQRQTDPNDRRRTLVRITPKGEESRLICESRLNDYITGIMDDLGEEFCQQFAKDAETLLQAIERQNEKLLAENRFEPEHRERIEDNLRTYAA